MTSSSASGAPLRIQDWIHTARPKLAERLARSPAGQPFSAGEPEENVHFAAGLEIQILVGHVLDRSRTWVIAHPETQLSGEQEGQLAGLLDRRLSGEPLPYLLGHWEFYGLDFTVTPDVLIPRPETELLVERALEHLRTHAGARAADAGTGSGCIAVSLLKHAPSLHMVAVDLSWRALQVARRNATCHGVLERLTLAQSDLLAPYAGPFDLVCANLPYIPRLTVDGLEVARHEPRLALDGGDDGLSAIRRLIEDSPRWLSPGGMLLLEMQYDQGDAILQQVRQHLPGSQAGVLHDLTGKPRLVEIRV